MKTLRMLVLAVVVLGAAAFAGTAVASAAATVEMAYLVPSDAKAFLETVDAAGLRQMLLESKFWAALRETEACRKWLESPKHKEMQERISRLLGKLKMTQDQALKTYLGGRSAVVLFEGEGKKHGGVLLTDSTNELSQRFVKATGGVEVAKYRDIAIYDVRNEKKTDRVAFAGDVMFVSGSQDDALERVLDVAAGSGSPLGANSQFTQAVTGLSPGWRVRAWTAVTPPRKGPGALTMYPQDKGRVHFEWRMIGTEGDLSLNAPVPLTGIGALPDGAVAAVATAFHPDALWNFAKAKASEKPDGAEKIRRAEMFIRGWFPGCSMEAITGGLGPEAALALVKGSGGSAPGLLGLIKLTAAGRPVADSFKNGLAAKAMILGALTEKNEKAPKLNVREEAYGNASMVIIEVSPGVLEKFLGDWAKDIALAVAVTNDWLILGTSPAGVRQAIDTASGKGTSLAADLARQGEKLPAGPATRWGVIQPASGADIVLGWAERLAGKEKVEQAKKLTNLAELLKLVKRLVWQRIDEPTAIRGTTDIQAID